MKEHVHKWVLLTTVKRMWFFGGKQTYSKCECGLMRHDNDGDIFDPKIERKRFFK